MGPYFAVTELHNTFKIRTKSSQSQSPSILQLYGRCRVLVRIASYHSSHGHLNSTYLGKTKRKKGKERKNSLLFNVSGKIRLTNLVSRILPETYYQ